MGDETGDLAPTRLQAVARVQAISDPKALKRHLLRMFEQGQPRYTNFYDAHAEPWNLFPDMVDDFIDSWQPIDFSDRRPKRLVIAMALTLSMPAGVDPLINETAALT